MNTSLKPNSEIRKSARESLSGKWGTALLLCLIAEIISGLPGAIPYIGPIITLLIAGPFMLGLIGCFLQLIRSGPFRFESLFDGFKNFSSAFILQLLITIFTLLWSLLLVIPGIIAAYRYSMSFYILYDNPQMSAKEALEESKKMMNGFKGKLFLLHLSFIGWGLLCLLTLGIGYLWLVPYIQTSTAHFYQNLKDSANANEPAM
jgi:Predicted integral membrane protein